MKGAEIKNTKPVWADYIERDLAEPKEDRIKRMALVCARCKYSNRIAGHVQSSSPEYIICDYILKTGHMRGCSVIDCNKFEPKRKEAKKKWAE